MPTLSPETKTRLRATRAALVTFVQEIIAPAIVIGVIGAAGKLSHPMFLVYLFAANLVYWRFLKLWKDGPTLKLRVKNIFNLPADGEPDFDRMTTQEHVEVDQDEPWTVIGIRNNAFFEVPCESKWDAVMLFRAIHNHRTKDGVQLVHACKTGDEENTMLKMTEYLNQKSPSEDTPCATS